MSIRLRYAPSPTGYLHIGGARTALFNWAYARRMEGTFVVRVEDTDRARSTAEYEASVLEALLWLGMEWDEGPGIGGPYGPYRQTERFARYAEWRECFSAAGHTYPCFCSPERLGALRAEQMAAKITPAYDRRCRDLDPGEARRRVASGAAAVVRFRVPLDGETRVKDLISGDVVFRNAEVDDWIMVRADASPTYNFCAVCDDADMRISHVLRGEEHLTNTPKQVLLFEALGLEPPLYGHLPLMLGKDKKKLSKRSGDTSVQDYRDKGYPPEAVTNFLALQGWSLDDKTTILSRSDLVEHFEPRDVSRGGSIFDPEKFLWMAGEYVHGEEIPLLAEHCAPYMTAAQLMTEEELRERAGWYRRAIASERERIRLYSEMPLRLAYLFEPDDALVYQEKALENARKHPEGGAVLENYTAWLKPLLDDGEKIELLREKTRAWVGQQGLKFPVLFQPLRCALTGAPGGADLFEIMALLGPESTLRRCTAGLRRFEG